MLSLLLAEVGRDDKVARGAQGDMTRGGDTFMGEGCLEDEPSRGLLVSLHELLWP